MKFFILTLIVSTFATDLQEYNETNVFKPLSNFSDGNKDMYVINAMVYQVGIITNKTSDETDTNLGEQEAVTFFHSNGSNVDFSKIPQPILTNVTAQSIIGVIPRPSTEIRNSLPGNGRHKIQAEVNYYKNSTSPRQETVKVVKGSALILEEAGVHSIAIPPLLALNNNFTHIPVPIPNTSELHYSKINTVLHIPRL